MSGDGDPKGFGPPDDEGAPMAIYGCAAPFPANYVDEYTPLFSLQAVEDLLANVEKTLAKGTHPIKQRAVAEYREAAVDVLHTHYRVMRDRPPPPPPPPYNGPPRPSAA